MTSSHYTVHKATGITAAAACVRRSFIVAVTVVTSLSAVNAQEQLPSIQGTGALPRDLSPWGMFMNADVVVKAVMVGLVVASAVTWTVWLAKTIQLLLARRQGARARKTPSATQTPTSTKKTKPKKP